ncbi:MAG: hypothetical protein AB8G05_21290 [Oligoflexales bacterium]
MRVLRLCLVSNLLFTSLFVSDSYAQEHETVQEYYTENFLNSLHAKSIIPVLVASGWSESSLGRMEKYKHLHKQSRGFAPSYLFAVKHYLKYGKVKLAYLSTTPISQAYRRYLFKIASGYGQLSKFKAFENECYLPYKFEPSIFEEESKESEEDGMDDEADIELQAFEYLRQGDNKSTFQKLEQDIHDFVDDDEYQVIGYEAHNTGKFLESWAKALRIPLLGNNPHAAEWGHKSLSRLSYKEAGIPHPRGTYEPEKNRLNIAIRIYELMFEHKIKKFIVKLEKSAAGDGNKILDLSGEFADPLFFDEDNYNESLVRIICKMNEWSDSYIGRMIKYGAIVEEFFEGFDFTSPASMYMVNGENNIHVLSAYDQSLGGRNNLRFEGGAGPTNIQSDNDFNLLALSHKVGKVLARNGVAGHVGTDFICFKTQKSLKSIDSVYAIENNVRHTGTMYPFRCAYMLLGEKRLQKKFYQSNDFVKVKKYKKKSERREFQKSFYDWLFKQKFTYDGSKRIGVLVHADYSALGNIAICAIADNRKEADELVKQASAAISQWSNQWSKKFNAENSKK